jgi:hypothetical protein
MEKKRGDVYGECIYSGVCITTSTNINVFQWSKFQQKIKQEKITIINKI